LREADAALRALTGSDAWRIATDDGFEPPSGAARQVFPEFELYVPLADLIDVEAERARLRRALEEAEAELARVEAKLANEQFTSRAPAEVVEKERSKREEFQQKKARLEASLASLAD